MNRILQIKYKRLKPEERFLFDILVQVKPKISDDYADSVFYLLKDVVLFEYNKKNGYFWCDYDKIWSVFQNKFNYKYSDIQIIIKKVVLDTLKFKDITPIKSFLISTPIVLDTLKFENITPLPLPY